MILKKGRIYVPELRSVMQINLIVSHGRMLLNFLEAVSTIVLRLQRLLDAIEYEITGRVEVETLVHFSSTVKNLSVFNLAVFTFTGR